MVSSQTNKKKKTMIILVMLPFKMVAGVKVALEVLVVLIVQIFQTFLKIFLETLVVDEEEAPEDVIQIIEGQI